MKIIIGTDSFAPSISGVSIFAERLANFLSENGHEVYIFAPSATAKSFIDKSFKKFTVFRLGSINNPFRKSHHIAFRPARAIKTELEKIGQPDIIHLQDPTSISAALLKYADQNNIPVVITNHFSLDFILSYVKYLKFLHPAIIAYLKRRFARFYDRCTLVTTPSETAKRGIENWGFKTPIKVMSNGINTERFHPVDNKAEIKKKFGLPDKPVVIYSGRIDKDKSVEVLVRSIPIVLKKVNAHFFFVGSGQEVESLKLLAKELKVEESTTFYGWLDYNSPDFPLAYQCSSVFASASCIEIQSIVMLEAFSTGLPVVAARGGSFPEFVKDGENGYLFRPGNHEEMADKIIQTLSDKNRWEHLSRGAIQTVKDHELNRCLGNFATLYENILAKDVKKD